MKEAYKPIITSILDQRCEVYTTDNHLLMLGKVTDYKGENDEIRLEDFRGKDIPWKNMSNGTRIRIFAHDRKSRTHLNIIEGVIQLAMTRYVLLDVVNVMEKEEGRKNFRQGVSVQAKIARSSRPEETEECEVLNIETGICRLIDISITGVGLTNETEYEVGDEIIISDVQLRENSVIHSFVSKIVRKRTLENGEKFYGCEFRRLTTKEEDRLMQDIFALQSKDLNG